MILIKSVYKLLGLGLVICFFSSCINFQEVKIEDIKTIHINELGNSSLRFNSEIKISNPNLFEIKVIDSNFDVFIKNTKVGQAKFEEEITIPGNSSNYVDVSFKGSYNEADMNTLSSLMGSVLFGNKEIDFKVDGFVEGKALWIKRKIELQHEGKVPLELFNPK